MEIVAAVFFCVVLQQVIYLLMLICGPFGSFFIAFCELKGGIVMEPPDGNGISRSSCNKYGNTVVSDDDITVPIRLRHYRIGEST